MSIFANNPDGAALRKKAFIVLVILVFFVVVKPLRWIDAGSSKDTPAEQKATSESCKSEIRLTEDESVAQCKDAAALFGHDMSDDVTKTQNCIQHHQNMVASCQKE